MMKRSHVLLKNEVAFHFLTTPQARAAYLARMSGALKDGGSVIIATFGLDGPERCSGMPVCRYDAKALSQVLGEAFQLQETVLETHRTPAGAAQQFIYCRFSFNSSL